MVEFRWQSGDRLPAVATILKDAAQDPITLTGADVNFVMRRWSDGVVVIDGDAVVDPDQTVNKGKVTYSPDSDDTIDSGFYYAQWRVIFNGGLQQTFPTVGYHTFEVVESLAGVGIPDATFALIRRLRRMIAEPDVELYGDKLLEQYLLEVDDNPVLAAVRVWEEKAAAYAELVDVSDSGSSRKMSQLYDQARKQIVYFSGQNDIATSPASGPMARPIERV